MTPKGVTPKGERREKGGEGVTPKGEKGEGRVTPKGAKGVTPKGERASDPEGRVDLFPYLQPCSTMFCQNFKVVKFRVSGSDVVIVEFVVWVSQGRWKDAIMRDTNAGFLHGVIPPIY